MEVSETINQAIKRACVAASLRIVGEREQLRGLMKASAFHSARCSELLSEYMAGRVGASGSL